jgi:oxygen-independent coproporphyrinogen-3 oxidase
MAPVTVAALIERADRQWSLASDIEITLEANPTSVEAASLRAFRDAGVNRVSLGVQALEAEALQRLGREHGVSEALAAVDLAAHLFPRHSFDLIYARPGQTLAGWEAELRRALGHVRDHLSLYQLTIEPGTRYHTLARKGELALPDEDTVAALFELTQDMLGAAGLPAYEISNHARAGGESRHNLTYWRYGDYAGIGPGAHGRLTLEGTRWATMTERLPERWLASPTADRREQVTQSEQLVELLMMGLRLAEGVPLARIEAVTGMDWPEALDSSAVQRLVTSGHLALTDERLIALPSGRQRLNRLLVEILP